MKGGNEMQNITATFGVKVPVLVLCIIAWVFLLISVFLILMIAFKIPTSQSKKNRRKIAQNMASKTNVLDDASEKIASWLSRKGIYAINQYKREKLQAEFNVLEIKKTPEEHLIGSILRGLVFSLIGPLFLIAAYAIGMSGYAVIGLILGLLIGVFMGVFNYNSIDKIIAARKEEIEKELPRFVSIVEQNLKFDDNLPGIIEEYVKGSDSPLCKELNKSLADIKTGDYENAMSKMAARVNSSLFSEVARGLSSALRGENTVAYFETLSVKLKERQALLLEKERLKLPKKTTILVKIMLGTMFLLYAVVIAVSIMDQISIFKGF